MFLNQNINGIINGYFVSEHIYVRDHQNVRSRIFRENNKKKTFTMYFSIATYAKYESIDLTRQVCFHGFTNKLLYNNNKIE